MITTFPFPEYFYGDEITIKGQVNTPESSNDFNYKKYLSRFNIYSLAYHPKIFKLSEQNRGGTFKKTIFKSKNKIKETIELGLPEPESSLAKAIIVGDKKGIPDELRDNFSKAGLSHIVAISGMHIGILTGIIMWLFLIIGLTRKSAFYLSVLFLIIYITLVGAPASAVRAGIMGFLVLLALNIGRLSKIINSLAFTAVILLVINPKLLRDDIGFQLSFLAIIGIIYFYPLLNKITDRFSKENKFLKAIFGIINVSLSAQVFTTPIIFLNFHTISVISPISNLLILWTLPILMICLILAVLLSLIVPNFVIILFTPSYVLLKYIILITNTLIAIPHSYF